jgi:uncharacterized protein YbjT (DUF2867 family)
MVGSGVLRTALLDDVVEKIVVVGRRETPLPADVPLDRSQRVTQLVVPDLTDLSAIEGALTDLDACLFCLGISSMGLDEAAYTRITYDTAMTAGRALAKHNPGLTMCFVSGAGTDASGAGRSMWARVKGKTENDLRTLPYKRSYAFRPGIIKPVGGVTSKTAAYRIVYTVLGPVVSGLVKVAPGLATTSEVLARAMLRVARDGADIDVFESKDINRVGA